MSKKVKCIDCHFLFSGWYYEDGRPNQIERKSAHIKLRNEFDKLIGSNGAYLIGCHFGIWEETSPLSREPIKKQVRKLRDIKKCFYYNFEEGLSLKGAEILQKRDEDREAFKTTMFYSRAALIIAILTLLGTVVLPQFYTTALPAPLL